MIQLGKKRGMPKFDKKDIVLSILFSSILVVLMALDIEKLNLIGILNDEFGYWSVAASLAGKDWSQLIKITPYYNFGYSLLLVPLFWLFDSYSLMYRAAILLNIALVIGSFFLLKILAKEICNIKSVVLQNWLAFIICIYPSVLFQSQNAWSETLLYFLFILSVVLFGKYEKKPTYGNMIGLCFCLGYMYAVHQRTILILLSAIFVICIYILKEKKYLKQGILGIVICIVCILMIGIFKDYLVECLWSSSEISDKNDISGGLIVKYLDIMMNNFGKLVRACFGILCYFVLVTGPFLIWGFVDVIKNGIDRILGKRSILYVKVYIIVAFLLTVATCCLTGMTGGDGRLDMVFYSRYAENTIGPVLLLGFGVWLKKEHLGKEYLGIIVLTTVLAFAMTYACKDIMETTFNVPCSVGLGAAFQLVKERGNALYIQNKVVILIVTALYFFDKLFGSELKNKAKKSTVLGLVACCWIFIFMNSKEYVLNHRNNIDNQIINSINKTIEDFEEYDLIYILDEQVDGYGRRAKFIQFINQNRPINVIDIEKIEKKDIREETLYLIERRSNVPEEIKTNGILISSSHWFYVYKMK